MSSVLIFESSLSGHRAYYVRVLANELLRLGASVTLALPEDMKDSDEGKVFLGDLLPNVRLSLLPPLPTAGSMMKGAQARFDLLVQAHKQCRSQHVFVPYADGISQAWGLKPRPSKIFPTGTIVEGLMMRGSYAYPSSSVKERAVKEIGFQLLRRSGWSRIHQLDALAFKEVQRRAPSFAKRNFLIPEAIEPPTLTDRETACKLLKLDPAKEYVCCPGLVSERKGVDLLIGAFAKADLKGAAVILLGRHTAGINTLLASEFTQLVADKKVISIDRFASEQEFQALFAVANLICIPYPKHIGSASILIKAAQAGCEVLASNWGWVGWATKTYFLGQTCDVTQRGDFAQSLMKSMLKQGPGTSVNQHEEQRNEFLSYHSLQNHLSCFTSLYRSLHKQ